MILKVGRHPIKCGNSTCLPQQLGEILKEKGGIIGHQRCFYEVFSENICCVVNDEDLVISPCMVEIL